MITVLLLLDRVDQGMLRYDACQNNTQPFQGLLAVPFVLHSQPTAIYQEHSEGLKTVAADTHQRYAEILRDVENLIVDHSQSDLLSVVSCPLSHQLPRSPPR